MQHGDAPQYAYHLLAIDDGSGTERVNRGADDYHGAAKPDGDGWTDGHVHRGGKRNHDIELSVAAERDGDRRSHFEHLHHSAHHHVRERIVVYRHGYGRGWKRDQQRGYADGEPGPSNPAVDLLRQPGDADGGNAVDPLRHFQLRTGRVLRFDHDWRLHRQRHDRDIHRRWRLHDPGHAGWQQHVCSGYAGLAELHGQRRSDRADHHLRQSRDADSGKAADALRHRQFRSDRVLRFDHDQRLHGQRHDRDIHRRWRLHDPGHAGWQQHVCSGYAGLAELHGQRRSDRADHHLRQSRDADSGKAADALRHRQFRSDRVLRFDHDQRLHGQRHDRDIHRRWRLHDPGHAGWQQHVCSGYAGLADFHGQ